MKDFEIIDHNLYLVALKTKALQLDFNLPIKFDQNEIEMTNRSFVNKHTNNMQKSLIVNAFGKDANISLD